MTHLRWAGWRFAVLPRECFLTHFPHPISTAKQVWLSDRALHGAVDRLYTDFTREFEAKYGPQGGPRTKLCSMERRKITSKRAR